MLPIHPRSSEIGQQGGVDVDHPVAKPGDHRRRDQLQISRQHDELRIPQRREQLGGVAGVTQHGRGDRRAARARERAGVGATGDHARDARQRGIVKGIEECLQVRAAARHEHGDTNRQGVGH